MTKIGILTVGSRGDVQPYIALGKGLKAAGYEVRLAAPSIFEDFIRAHELDFFPLSINPKEIMEGKEARFWIESERNLIGYLRMFQMFTQNILTDLHIELWQAAQGCDALIYTPFALAAHAVAQKLGIPRLVSGLQPLGRTTEFPNILLPAWLNLGATFNYNSYLVAEQVVWQPIRGQVNRNIARDLEMPPVGVRGPFELIYAEQTPVLYGYSPLISPAPKDWPAWHHVTGFWHLDPSPSWQPDPELLEFLDKGAPPVYIGFGSMPNRKPRESAQIALKALKKAGQRGILLTGWGGIEKSELPDDVLMVDSVPHTWLFPRMAAVVHHGGAGTVGAGLRAGVPSIVVPHFADQPFWGERVYEQGVGPKPIPRWRLNAGNFAKAIRTAIEDEKIRARAKAMGEQLRKEDGIGNAIKVIRQTI